MNDSDEESFSDFSDDSELDQILTKNTATPTSFNSSNRNITVTNEASKPIPLRTTTLSRVANASLKNGINSSYFESGNSAVANVYRSGTQLQNSQNNAISMVASPYASSTQKPSAVGNNNNNQQRQQTQIPTQQTQTQDDINTDVYTLKGENAILRAQLDQIKKINDDKIKQVRDHFNSLLREKSTKLENLSETLSKYKTDNEFLASENKSLPSKYIRPLKKRKINPNEIQEINQTLINKSESEDNDTSMKDTSSSTDYSKSKSRTTNTTPDSVPNSNSGSFPPYGPSLSYSSPSSNGSDKTRTQIALVNQSTIFQDEKNSFIESISVYVIPGFQYSTLDYLSNISSSISIDYKDFKINEKNESIKSKIIDYLINFGEQNRIDLLLSSFIDILVFYIENLFADKSLLPIPFLLSLVQFSLNYRIKALGESIIERITKMLGNLINSNFLHILKQDIRPFLLFKLDNSANAVSNEINDSLKQKKFTGGGNSNSNSNNSNNEVSMDLIETTIHNKILECSITVFSMDILEQISKTSFYFNEINDNKEFLKIFWINLPKDLIYYSLSIQTPIQFIFNSIEILINSINQFKFSFSNSKISNNGNHKNRNLNLIKEENDLLDNLINLININLNSNYDLRIYGLNRLIGSNLYSKLIESLIPDNNNSINWKPIPHPIDYYLNVIQGSDNGDHSNDGIGTKNNNKESLQLGYNIDFEDHQLNVKYRILQLFETFFAIRNVKNIKLEVLIHLISSMTEQLGKQQEIIMRSPRCHSISMRMKIIELIVKLTHYLINEQQINNLLPVSKLPHDTLREIVIIYLKISAISVKNETIEFINEQRQRGFRKFIIDENISDYVHDKFGVYESNDINEINLSNYLKSLELNKNEEVIEIDENEDVNDEKGVEEEDEEDEEFYDEFEDDLNDYHKEINNSEIFTSNGLEFNYQDETIDMAREILGQCITGDEADLLYYSMNYVSDNDIDAELIYR
ncbi:unnamed protein product [[Candida] boidinii]|uniref:Unnamed protein product n=1 Tax=Candida boidinii TaxID=5477 RepID=A0A9W6SY14_CANBO|nr:hypothetical protein B5S30_g3430 [[Candida] boidinii]OWB85126.1 hypothetical protein B5S33_g3784 [[Candida] boidinii]GME68582.1 unnamed protein product [[Candida] boidinii]